MQLSLSQNDLENFQPKFAAVSCFVEWGDKFLMLKRHSDKPQGETWCLPSGKIGEDETREYAIMRELNEETGIKANASDLKYELEMFVRYPDYDFVFHTYSVSVETEPSIYLNDNEHSEYMWVTKEEVLNLAVIPGFIEQLKLHYVSPKAKSPIK
jgi:8-oxo-dGTP pyrophosphatase MutT (NUDIX family)